MKAIKQVGRYFIFSLICNFLLVLTKSGLVVCSRPKMSSTHKEARDKNYPSHFLCLFSTLGQKGSRRFAKIFFKILSLLFEVNVTGFTILIRICFHFPNSNKNSQNRIITCKTIIRHVDKVINHCVDVARF